MKSNLREISIQSILKLMVKEQKTGLLSVEIPIIDCWGKDAALKNSVSSKIEEHSSLSYTPKKVISIAFLGGQITHVFKQEQNELTRLKDYLTYYQLETKIERYLTNCHVNNPEIKEYHCLIWFLQQHYLQPSQIRLILLKLMEESIFDIFLCKQGTVTFQVQKNQYPLSQVNSTRKIIEQLESKLRQWQQFYPHILDPHQVLDIKNRTDLKTTLSTKTYQCLTSWTDNKKSLLQLSRQLNCSLIYIGKAIYPYLQKGLLKLVNSNEPSST